MVIQYHQSHLRVVAAVAVEEVVHNSPEEGGLVDNNHLVEDMGLAGNTVAVVVDIEQDIHLGTVVDILGQGSHRQNHVHMQLDRLGGVLRSVGVGVLV